MNKLIVTANETPAAKVAGFFCCPGSSAYGILEAEIPVVEKERFTTFLLLLAASICRILPSDEFHFGKRGTDLTRRELRKMRHPAA
jgi:hypothetical protein